MKALKTATLAAVVVLSGCASSGSSAPQQDSVHWWNPLSYSWSSALPWNWFGSDVQVTEQGVGGLNSLTPMTSSAIREALGSGYQLREGMRTRDGNIVNFWQVQRDGKVMLDIQGQDNVSRVVVTDPRVTSVKGVKLGSKFSDLYSQAFGHCQPGETAGTVLCQAPSSEHIQYRYQGETALAQGMMPADATLQNWTLSEIIWHQ